VGSARPVPGTLAVDQAPYLGLEHEVVVGREYADHGDRGTADRQGGADQVGRTPEPALPEAVADHHDLGLVGPAFFGQEVPTGDRLYPEGREEVRRHPSDLNQDRLLLTDDGKRLGKGRDGRQVLEAPILVREIVVVHPRDRTAHRPRIGLEASDEPVRFRKRQVATHQTEQRRGRPDPQRQDKDRDDRKTGIPLQPPDRVSEVVGERVEERTRPLLPHPLLQLFDPPQLHQGFPSGPAGRHTFLDQLGHPQIEVALQLLVQIVFQRFPVKKRPEGASQARGKPPLHHSSPVLAIIRNTRAASG
jgi:hypothetical protein